MPAIGETVNEGKLAKWFKKTGDQINEGDILCEVESDKTTMEIPSTINGNVQCTLYNEVGKIIQTYNWRLPDFDNNTIDVNTLKLRSGIYFVRMIVGDFVSTQKLLLVK